MSIDLDKRIIKGKKPLSAFDELESKYIGTDCFFSDKPSDFADLSNCQVGKLMSLDAVSGMFGASKNNSYAVFNYCLPCEWVKEEKKEPKYRPYTIDDFLKKFKLGDSIILKRKDKNAYEVALFTGYYDKGIYLGAYDCKLEYLFSDYELGVNYDEFVPFGVLEDD